MMRVLAERRQRGRVAGAVVLVAAMALALWPGAGRGEERKALLMPGKSSLYQRILTRPGALLHESPGAAGEGVALPPLSVFFVFERRQLGAQQWLEIGSSPVGNPYGWILGDKAIDWRQTLTVAFTRTSDREATLFFRDRDTLMQLMESESLVRDVDQYRAQIKNDDIPEGFPILSIEPSTFVDPNEQFYLLSMIRSRGVVKTLSFSSSLPSACALVSTAIRCAALVNNTR
jgi:serine/threonine-protein kinase PpkA